MTLKVDDISLLVTLFTFADIRPADEITQIAAANIGSELLALMAKTPLVV